MKIEIKNRNAPQKRVMLVWPSFGGFHPYAAQNFFRLIAMAVRMCPSYLFDPFVIARTSVHTAMNQAVDTAIEQGHEAIIAFDDDCLPELAEFPLGDSRRFQVIGRLLALLEKGHKIVTGVGYMRGYPYTTTVGRFYPFGQALVLDEDATRDQNNVKGFHWLNDLAKYRDELDEDGLLTADFAGVPIIAIHRDVLLKIPHPLFQTTDSMGGQSTHDIYFCNKAREAGFTVKVDTHIDCGHLVEQPIVNKSTKADLATAMAAVNARQPVLA